MTAAARLRRRVFAVYLRHQEPLTRYLEWLAGGRARHPVRRWILAVISRGLARHFLVALRLSPEQAGQRLRKAQRIGVTRCVCAACHGGEDRETCLFLDDGLAAYEGAGPYPVREIPAEEAVGILNREVAADALPVTPVNPGAFPLFPERYCVCLCRADDCLPRRFAESYGIRTAVTEDDPPARPTPGQRSVFVLSLCLMPLLLLHFAAYRRGVLRVEGGGGRFGCV